MLKEEIATLEGKTDKEEVNRRRKLYDEKRKLIDRELRDWQKRQPNKPDDTPGYHRAIFSRASFMMPERDSLRCELSKVDTLRSPTGLNALRAMIAIYQKRSEVEHRPGLEPDKCCCSKRDENKPDGDLKASYDWKHVYTCYKRSCENVSGFAELCFLCDEWVCGNEAWEDHCKEHLPGLQQFPPFCDPLTHGGVLATAGYCPFCLTDTRLPASARLSHFLIRGKWLSHIHNHIRCLDANKPVKCPHPQPHCATLFDSVKLLQFHLQDAHGIDFIKETASLKRKRCANDKSLPARGKKLLHGYQNEADEKEVIEWEYAFVNTTIENMSDRDQGGVKTSSSCSTPLHSLDSTLMEDDTSYYSGTPIASVYSEELIDPAILSVATELDLDDVSLAKFPATESATKNPAYPGDTSNALFIRETPCQEHIIVLETHKEADMRTQGTFQRYYCEDASKESSPSNLQELESERPPAIDPEDDQWEVERLIEKRQIGRTIKYLVKWLGYPDSENTWEKRKDIDPHIVSIFEAELV